LHSFLLHRGSSSSDITITSSSSSPLAVCFLALRAETELRPFDAYLLAQCGCLFFLESPHAVNRCSSVISETCRASVPTQASSEVSLPGSLLRFSCSPAASPLGKGEARRLRFGGIVHQQPVESRVKIQASGVDKWFGVAFPVTRPPLKSTYPSESVLQLRCKPIPRHSPSFISLPGSCAMSLRGVTAKIRSIFIRSDNSSDSNATRLRRRKALVSLISRRLPVVRYVRFLPSYPWVIFKAKIIDCGFL
jgi:hypothetical protein